MRDRFDELEDQLRQLDTIPLTPAEADASRKEVTAETEEPLPLESASQALRPEREPDSSPAGSERSVTGTKEVGNSNDPGPLPGRSQIPAEGKSNNSAQASCYVKPEPQSEVPSAPPRPLGWLAGAISDLSTRRLKSRVRVMEDQAISECQERMRQAVGEVIQDAQRQLESLAGQLVPSVQGHVEKSTENSRRTLESRLGGSMMANVQSSQHTVNIVSESDVVQTEETACKPPRMQVNIAPQMALNGDEIHKRLLEAFVPVVEEIQAKTEAFLDHLNLQVKDTLRAFAEKATKHAAEEFQRIAVEVLQRELAGGPAAPNEMRIDSRPDRTAGTSREKLGIKAPEVVPLRPAASQERKNPLPSYRRSALPESQRRNEHPGDARRATTGGQTWRILGLG
jgi:hypothetical protein